MNAKDEKQNNPNPFKHKSSYGDPKKNGAANYRVWHISKKFAETCGQDNMSKATKGDK